MDGIVECRMCHDTKLKLFGSIRQYQLLECGECGLIQVVIDQTLEEIATIYGKPYFSHNKYRDSNSLRIENEKRRNLVRKYLPKETSKVLDAGCATGDFIEYVKKEVEIYGIDISEYAIQQAKEKNKEISQRIWAGRLEDQNLEEEFYDAICMWDVLEHILDFVPVCTQMMKYIKPRGYLFISTPNIGSWIARIMGKYWAMMTPPEHLSFFNKQSIGYLFERLLGGKIIEWESRGKWVNIGFIVYKVKRILPTLVPEGVLKLFETGKLSKMMTYVPTGDIQYVVVQKW